MAGYVWWAGWRGVEIVDVVDEEGDDDLPTTPRGRLSMFFSGGMGRGDPLWVVRGVKEEEEDGGTGGVKEKKGGGCGVL